MGANFWIALLSLTALAQGQGSRGDSQWTCEDTEWNYQGCYNTATLHNETYGWQLSTSINSHSYPGYLHAKDMTLDLCLMACRGHGFRFASLSNEEDCYCGTQAPVIGQTLDSDSTDNSTLNTCHIPPATTHGCTGNRNEWCGSALGSDVYEDPSFSRDASAGDASNYEYLGCFTYVAPGAWAVRTTTKDLDSCMAYCGNHGYSYAYGIAPDGEWDNCGCATEVQAGLEAYYEDRCDEKCNPNTDLTCGGEHYISAYLNKELQGCFKPSIPGTKLGTTTRASSVKNQVALAPRAATDPTTATPYTYVGCWSDNVNGARSLRYQYSTPSLGGTANMTIENCAYTCNSYGFTIMGAEYYSQCWCDNALQGGALSGFGNCSTPCQANSAEECGGPNFLSLYSISGQVSGGSVASGTTTTTTTSTTTTSTTTTSTTTTSTTTTTTTPSGATIITQTTTQPGSTVTTTATTTTSLPAGTVTATSTKPASTVTATTSLPAGTVTATTSLAAGTVTTSIPAGTVTATSTAPASTITSTQPASTVTGTVTGTATVTGTVTSTQPGSTVTYTTTSLGTVTSTQPGSTVTYTTTSVGTVTTTSVSISDIYFATVTMTSLVTTLPATTTTTTSTTMTSSTSSTSTSTSTSSPTTTSTSTTSTPTNTSTSTTSTPTTTSTSTTSSTTSSTSTLTSTSIPPTTTTTTTTTSTTSTSSTSTSTSTSIPFTTTTTSTTTTSTTSSTTSSPTSTTATSSTSITTVTGTCPAATTVFSTITATVTMTKSA